MKNNYAEKFIKKSVTAIKPEAAAVITFALDNATVSEYFNSDNKKTAEKRRNAKEKRYFSILETIGHCDSRRNQLILIEKTASERLTEEMHNPDGTEKPESEWNKTNVYSYTAIMNDAKEELKSMNLADKEAEAAYYAKNTYINSYADLFTLPEKSFLIIMKKSVRYQIKKARSNVKWVTDENGERVAVSSPLYYGEWVDFPYFNANIDTAVNEMFIKLSELVDKYRKEEKYRTEVDSIAERKEIAAIRILCGRAAKNALQNVHDREYKHVRNIENDTEAMNCKTVPEWETEAAAIAKNYINSKVKSRTEAAVIRELETGYTGKEAAERLNISPALVSRKANDVLNRVRLDNVAAAVRPAVRNAVLNSNAKDGRKLAACIRIMLESGTEAERIAERLNIEDSKDKNGNVTETAAAKVVKLSKVADNTYMQKIAEAAAVTVVLNEKSRRRNTVHIDFKCRTEAATACEWTEAETAARFKEYEKKYSARKAEATKAGTETAGSTYKSAIAYKRYIERNGSGNIISSLRRDYLTKERLTINGHLYRIGFNSVYTDGSGTETEVTLYKHVAG